MYEELLQTLLPIWGFYARVLYRNHYSRTVLFFCNKRLFSVWLTSGSLPIVGDRQGESECVDKSRNNFTQCGKGRGFIIVKHSEFFVHFSPDKVYSVNIGTDGPTELSGVTSQLLGEPWTTTGPDLRA